MKNEEVAACLLSCAPGMDQSSGLRVIAAGSILPIGASEALFIDQIVSGTVAQMGAGGKIDGHYRCQNDQQA